MNLNQIIQPVIINYKACPGCKKHGNTVEGVMPRGPSSYCYKHYRIQSSRNRAAKSGKSIPDTYELERIFPDDMICPLCKKQMIYTKQQGKHEDIVTLQHWNDGTVQWICLSCNSSHGNTILTDGEYVAQQKEIPADMKMCRDCFEIKHLDHFYFNKNGSKQRGAYCKPCHVKRTTR